MPSLLLMLLLMPGMATTVIPTDTVDTTVDTVDTTATPPTAMPTIMERGLLMPRLSLLLMLLLMPGTDTTVIPDTTDTVIMDMVVITAGLMLVITWSVDERAYVETLFGHQDKISGIDCGARERCITVGGGTPVPGSGRSWR